jgi:hypothetical protein
MTHGIREVDLVVIDSNSSGVRMFPITDNSYCRDLKQPIRDDLKLKDVTIRAERMYKNMVANERFFIVALEQTFL